LTFAAVSIFCENTFDAATKRFWLHGKDLITMTQAETAWAAACAAGFMAANSVHAQDAAGHTGLAGARGLKTQAGAMFTAMEPGQDLQPAGALGPL